MGQKKVIYIAGPMTGVPRYYEAFEAMEDELSGMGYIPLSPSRLPEGMSNDQGMQICFAMINAADAVIFLDGWENSKGARLERDYCFYINKPAFTDPAFMREVLG